MTRWVCKQCFMAKMWWSMYRIYHCGYEYGWYERIHLCKKCYKDMIKTTLPADEDLGKRFK